MSLRSIGVKLQADVADYVRNMGTAARSTGEVGGQIDDMRTASDRAVPAVEVLGKSTKRSGEAAETAGDKFRDMRQDLQTLDRQILETEVAMTALARSFARTGDTDALKGMREQQTQMRNLLDVRKLLPKPDDEVTHGYGERITRGIIGGIVSSAGNVFRSVATGLQEAATNNPGITAGVVIGTALAPGIAAGLGGALSAGIGFAAIIGGIALVARDPAIQEAGKTLGRTFLEGLSREAEVFKKPVLDSLAQISAATQTYIPKIGQIFDNVAPSVHGLTENLLASGDALLNSFVVASSRSTGPMEAVGRMVQGVSTAFADMITTLSKRSAEGTSALDDLTNAMTNGIHAVTMFIDGLAQLKGGLDWLDNGIDKLRYGWEDLSDVLDLTADGYNKNSEAAKLYRQHIIGAAGSVNDYNAYLEKQKESQEKANGATGAGVKVITDMKEAQQGVTEAQQGLSSSLSLITYRQNAAKQSADALRSAMDGLYGAAVRQMDANEGYEASFDGLADSIKGHTHEVEYSIQVQHKRGTYDLEGKKTTELHAAATRSSTRATASSTKATEKSTDAFKTHTETLDGHVASVTRSREATYQHGGETYKDASAEEMSTETIKKHRTVLDRDAASLSIHTKVGRQNRDALEALITSTNNAYIADIEAGVAIDMARQKHDKRIKSIEKEANRLGLDKKATRELINTYGQIPDNETTNIVLKGVEKVVQAMAKMYAIQRALAEGVPVTSANIAANMAAFNNAGPTGTVKDFKADGGPIVGPGSKTSDSVPIMASTGEFMQRAAAVDHYGVDFMEDLNAKRIPREQVVGRYAHGGLVERRPMRIVVNASRTHVPTRAEAEAAVIPPGPPAGGMTYPWIIKMVHAAFPGLRPISTFRKGARTLSGNRSLHAIGDAVDWPASHALALFWNRRFGSITDELITPWNDLNLHRGKHHEYTGAIWNQHNFAGGNAHDHIGVTGRLGGGGIGMAIGRAAARGALGAWINMAMRYAGVPSSWAGPLSTLIMRESGGNPRAQNNWDSNARSGKSSRGLMQTIPSTFSQYRMKSLPNNIFDPVANIVAGIRYIESRYGTIFRVQQANPNLPPKGYANGGVINEPIVGVGASGRKYTFGEYGPETVTPGTGRWQASGGGGGSTAITYQINVSVPIAANQNEVGRQVVGAIQAYERGSGKAWRS